MDTSTPIHMILNNYQSDRQVYERARQLSSFTEAGNIAALFIHMRMEGIPHPSYLRSDNSDPAFLQGYEFANTVLRSLSDDSICPATFLLLMNDASMDDEQNRAKYYDLLNQMTVRIVRILDTFGRVIFDGDLNSLLKSVEMNTPVELLPEKLQRSQ